MGRGETSGSTKHCPLLRSAKLDEGSYGCKIKSINIEKRSDQEIKISEAQ